MSREYAVFQCYQCSAFSVNQITKNRKWKCKLCGSQQSIRKIFATSHQPKDLRPIVQQFNEKRGEIEQELMTHNESLESSAANHHHHDTTPTDDREVTYKQSSHSKWAKYDPKHQGSSSKPLRGQQSDDGEEQDDPSVQVVTSLPPKEKKKRTNKSSSSTTSRKRKTKNDDDEENDEYDAEDDSYSFITPSYDDEHADLGAPRQKKTKPLPSLSSSGSNLYNDSDDDDENDKRIVQSSKPLPKPAIKTTTNSKWSKYL